MDGDVDEGPSHLSRDALCKCTIKSKLFVSLFLLSFFSLSSSLFTLLWFVILKERILAVKVAERTTLQEEVRLRGGVAGLDVINEVQISYYSN